jgi:hypothetical protein
MTTKVEELHPEARELFEQAGYWAKSHKDFPLGDWKYEIGDGNTRHGYWEWLTLKLQERDLEDTHVNVTGVPIYTRQDGFITHLEDSTGGPVFKTKSELRGDIKAATAKKTMLTNAIRNMERILATPQKKDTDDES